MNAKQHNAPAVLSEQCRHQVHVARKRAPRIVPYIARELGKYGGRTSIAFARGRGLYREIVALDELARCR